jgi:anti-sigma B factor antagonist/stage II sporulation protein AA (anti-sigma F factor antagonist)
MSDVLGIEEIKATNGAVVLRIQGKLDANSTPVFLQHCRAVKEEKKNLVLNLSGVSFIASSGVGGLLVVTEEFGEAELQIRFAALSSTVDSVIQLLNLGSFLGIHATEDEALTSMAA